MRQTISVVAIILLSVLSGCDSGDGTGSVTLGPDGRLYVLNQKDGTMYIYDTSDLTRVDSIATHVKNPHYVEFSPDGQFYYITTLEETGHIAKFNAATNAFIDSVTVDPSVVPSAIAITADGAEGYVCNFSAPGAQNFVHVYDLTGDKPQKAMQLFAGQNTHDLKITGDGEIVVAVNRDDDDIRLYYTGADPDTAVRISIDPDNEFLENPRTYGPFGVIIDSRDSLAYIACLDARQVRVLDLTARVIVDSVDIPVTVTGFVDGPTLLAITPDDKTVFVTTQNGNSVVAFDTETMTVTADIPFGIPRPFGITITDDGSRVYAACINTNQPHGMVYVIDAEKLVKIDSITVGAESFGLTWRPPAP